MAVRCSLRAPASQRSYSKLSHRKSEHHVLTVAQALCHRLETHFGAPSGKDHGLHDKITAARDKRGAPLPENVKKRMRYLVTIRNSLVHDRDVNAIPDRSAFVAGWNEVESALKQLLPPEKSSCLIC